MEFLQSHSWPGNVRELENVMRKALLLAQGYTINVDHVRAALNKDSRPGRLRQPALGRIRGRSAGRRPARRNGRCPCPRAGIRRAGIVPAAIELAHGNQAKAARWLGVSRITMKAKLVQFGFHPGPDNEQTS